jgi:bifunctional DNase/RNase
MARTATVRGVGVSVGEDHEHVPVVLLDVDERVVPIFVSEDQAQSIQHALDGEPFDRPLTHDLLVEMITEFGGAVDRIRVDALHDGTFFAKVDAEQYRGGERRELTFDARPSDAIALALRLECPVELAEEVIEEAGRPQETFE